MKVFCHNALIDHEAGLNLSLNPRIIRPLHAPVAQLDRVAGSDPVGRGFDSLLARHKFL